VGRDAKWQIQMPISLATENGLDATIAQVAIDAEEASWNPLKRAYTHMRKDIVKQLTPVSEFARTSIESVTSNVSAATEEIKAVSGSVQKVLTSLTQFVADIPSHLPGADFLSSLIVSLISLLKIVFSSSEISVKIAGFTLFLSNYVNIPQVLTWAASEFFAIMRVMPDFLSWLTGNWRAQNESDTVLKVSSVFISLLVGVFLKKVPGKGDMDSILRRIDLLPKAIRGASDILKYVTTAVKTAVSVCCDFIGKPSPFDSGLPTESDQWVTSATSILTRKLTESTYTSKYADEVRTCYVEGLQLIRNLNTVKADFDVIRYIGSMQSQIAALNNRLAHLGFAAGPRTEPLMVYLHGSSGKGKSGLTVPFFIELAKSDPDFEASDWAKLLYMRCAETEFRAPKMDGAQVDHRYHGTQKCDFVGRQSVWVEAGL
jgi:hypothetical protein